MDVAWAYWLPRFAAEKGEAPEMGSAEKKKGKRKTVGLFAFQSRLRTERGRQVEGDAVSVARKTKGWARPTTEKTGEICGEGERRDAREASPGALISQRGQI